MGSFQGVKRGHVVRQQLWGRNAKREKEEKGAARGVLPRVHDVALPCANARSRVQPLFRAEKEEQEQEEDITKDERTLIKYIRNKVFRFIKAISLHQYEYALDHISQENIEQKQWKKESLETLIKDYYTDHKIIMLGREGRSHKNIKIKDHSIDHYKFVELTLVDPDGLNDWSAKFLVDLKKTKEDQEISLQLLDISEIAL